MKEYQALFKTLHDNLSQAIVGKQRALTLGVITLICRGHLLLQDVPGPQALQFWHQFRRRAREGGWNL